MADSMASEPPDAKNDQLSVPGERAAKWLAKASASEVVKNTVEA